MNQSKLDFILAIIICLILLFGFLILTKRFNCLNTFEHFQGTAPTISNQEQVQGDRYICHNENGCIKSDNGPFSSLEECEENCRFDFNGQQCVKLENPSTAEEGYYSDLPSCRERFKCDNLAGKCIKTSAKRFGSFDDINTCNNNCKFKSINNQTCSMLSNEELADTTIRESSFDNKNLCENRFSPIDGDCIKIAGGTYDMKRRCEYGIVNASPLDASNTNKITITFDKTINTLSDFNLRVFKETLTKIVIGEGDIISKQDIVGILIEDTKAIIVLNINFQNEHLRRLFDDLVERFTQISISVTLFNVIEIRTQVYNSNNELEELVQTRQTNQVLTNDEPHAFLKIDNIRDNTIKSTFFNSSSLDNANSNLNKSEKLQLLDAIEEDSTKASNNVDFPNSLFLELINIGDKHYRTPKNSSHFISVRKITSRFLDILEKKLYLDFDTIKAVYNNHEEVSYVIIGKHDKIGIFPYKNESYFLFFKNSEKKYKFRQIKVNSKLLKDLRIKEAHFSIISNTNIEDFKEEAYKIINLNVDKSDYLGSYESLLFGNFGNSLNIKITLTLQKGSTIIDIISFEEDRGLLSQESTCMFDPLGETLFECKSLCNEDSDINKCSVSDCHRLCHNCKNLKCKWNITDYQRDNSLKPNAATIKCFSGDRSVKITWLRPYSSTPVDKYYILVSNRINNDLHTYVYKSSLDINDYTVKNLKNGYIYDLQILCKNKFGVSRLSNIESVIPDEDKKLETPSEIKLSDFEDSIENYYKTSSDEQDDNEINYDIGHRISMVEREIIINDLKEALTDNLIKNNDLSSYNINIY